ncbi:MAG: potassium channel family protein [Thermoleophilia bacterium]|nr:potassium channel family protein [Thermoleophilia bacterium]
MDTPILAIFPFYVGVGRLDLRFLRALRLFRLLRVLKLARYSESLALLGRVFRAKKEELVVTLCAVLFLLFLASSFIYYVEHEAQPEAFSSIPAAMWWGVATLTTVGYGDVYPVTVAGKVLGAIVAMLGIGLFALPAGILASGFADEMRRKRTDETAMCPHCGRQIE